MSNRRLTIEITRAERQLAAIAGVRPRTFAYPAGEENPRVVNAVRAAGLALAVLFYLYGAMSFREYGFFTQDPWLGPKVLLAFTIGAAFQASRSDEQLKQVIRMGKGAMPGYGSLFSDVDLQGLVGKIRSFDPGAKKP